MPKYSPLHAADDAEMDDVPWRAQMQSNSQCSFVTVRYARPQELPVVLLATHEGGGFDWLRRLLEVATGFFCGIEDKQKQESGSSA